MFNYPYLSLMLIRYADAEISTETDSVVYFKVSDRKFKYDTATHVLQEYTHNHNAAPTIVASHDIPDNSWKAILNIVKA